MFLLSLVIIGLAYGQDEIFKNAGFEEAFGADDWYCVSCDLAQDTDAYSGQYSARITNRAEYWAGVSQNVGLASNTNYYFSVYVKLASMLEGAMWHQVDILIELDVDQGPAEYLWIARVPHLRLDQEWQKIGGDFYIDDRGISGFRAYIQVNVDREQTVDYLVDEASLTAFYDNPNWKEEANARIDQIRKNDVTLNVNIGGSYDPSNIEVQVTQTSKSYAFGSAIVDGQIAGDDEYNQRYQDTFYTHFNWAVHENAMKWYSMEPQRDQIIYPDESTRRLQERGVPLRGHAILWGVAPFVPDWVKTLTPGEVSEEIQQRFDYTVPRYADQLVHWDVNNEQEHGTWFEDTLGNPTILYDFFQDARARDSDAILFLNDYEIVSGGGYSQALLNTAVDVNTATGLVGGVGAQCHFQGPYPDVTQIQRRLDAITSYGFPIWVTELDIELEDREERANAYDDVTTLLYSNPGVHGILLWGFSDLHHWRPNCALFEGEFFEPNAAGLRWQEMMFNRWSTSETFNPQSPSDSFGFRGFHGSYQIRVTNSGTEVLTQQFDLPAGSDITVDVEVV